MRRNLIELLEIALELSQHTPSKVAFAFLPKANMVTFHVYNTNRQYSVCLGDADAKERIGAIENELLELTSGMEELS